MAELVINSDIAIDAAEQLLAAPEVKPAEGLAIAREIASEIRPLVQGIQISTAGGSIENALGVMEAVVA